MSDSSGVVTNMLDCDIWASELKLRSRCYIHFPINTVGKGMNPFIPLSWIVPHCFGIK